MKKKKVIRKIILIVLIIEILILSGAFGYGVGYGFGTHIWDSYYQMKTEQENK